MPVLIYNSWKGISEQKLLLLLCKYHSLLRRGVLHKFLAYNYLKNCAFKVTRQRHTSLTHISKLSYSHHVCSSLPLQQQHCWLYHRGILQSGLYVLIAFFQRLWTSPLSIMSSFKEMGFDMTEQRECEGHREHRIPNVFLSFLILNGQKFEIFNVYYITPTFLLWRN